VKKRSSADTEVGPVQIRVMTVSDLPDVLLIEHTAFPTPWTENMFKEDLLSSLCFDMVATWSGQIVGYIDFALIIDEIHLRNVAVHAGYRNRGVAAMLLDEMMRIAGAKGAKWCTLEVRRSNVAAIKLYEKYGFEIRGVRPLYYRDTGEDALIMWTALREHFHNSSNPDARKEH